MTMTQCKNRILFHMPVLGIHFQLGLHCCFHILHIFVFCVFSEKNVVLPELVCLTRFIFRRNFGSTIIVIIVWVLHYGSCYFVVPSCFVSGLHYASEVLKVSPFQSPLGWLGVLETSILVVLILNLSGYVLGKYFCSQWLRKGVYFCWNIWALG